MKIQTLGMDNLVICPESLHDRHVISEILQAIKYGHRLMLEFERPYRNDEETPDDRIFIRRMGVIQETVVSPGIGEFHHVPE